MIEIEKKLKEAIKKAEGRLDSYDLAVDDLFDYGCELGFLRGLEKALLILKEGQRFKIRVKQGDTAALMAIHDLISSHEVTGDGTIFTLPSLRAAKEAGVILESEGIQWETVISAQRFK